MRAVKTGIDLPYDDDFAASIRKRKRKSVREQKGNRQTAGNVAAVRAHSPRYPAILQETFPKARKVFDKIDADIRVILTAEQRKKLDALKRKYGPFPPAGIGPHKRPPGLPPFGPLGGPPPFERGLDKRAKPDGTP